MWITSLLGAGLIAMAVVASAQSVPTARDQVARPGGQVPGLPALAVVKVAEGFNDPVGVTAANDGSGRMFVVERVGRIKVVAKDGRVLPEPFLDLTKTNPLGSEVQTGFVEQGLWSVAFHPKFKDKGHIFVHYASLPFNGASIVARHSVDRASPDRITTEQANKTVKVIMNTPSRTRTTTEGRSLSGRTDSCTSARATRDGKATSSTPARASISSGARCSGSTSTGRIRSSTGSRRPTRWHGPSRTG